MRGVSLFLHLLSIIFPFFCIALGAQQGANINMRDMSGRTAVFYAACKGHKSTVFLLLDNNADINAKYVHTLNHYIKYMTVLH